MDVTNGGGVTVASITQSGWYTFRMTWESQGADQDTVSHISVLDASGAEVGTPLTATNVGYKGADMQGNGYIWLTQWTNGFAGDRLSIDNLKAGVLQIQWRSHSTGSRVTRMHCAKDLSE